MIQPVVLLKAQQFFFQKGTFDAAPKHSEPFERSLWIIDKENISLRYKLISGWWFSSYFVLSNLGWYKKLIKLVAYNYQPEIFLVSFAFLTHFFGHLCRLPVDKPAYRRHGWHSQDETSFLHGGTKGIIQLPLYIWLYIYIYYCNCFYMIWV